MTTNKLILTGSWHHGNGVLACGSIRVANEDFDTNPSQQFKTELFDWMCGTLNSKVDKFEAERRAQIMLPRAIVIATEQHKGQVDKAGQPYIDHPMRVMRAMRSNIERIVAVLHDVVEDGSVTLAKLQQEGLSKEILEAIDSVTRRAGEDYEEFIERAGQNSIGRWVKYEDLRDNSNMARITNPTESDFVRTAKYQKAMARLESFDAVPALRPQWKELIYSTPGGGMSLTASKSATSKITYSSKYVLDYLNNTPLQQIANELGLKESTLKPKLLHSAKWFARKFDLNEDIITIDDIQKLQVIKQQITTLEENKIVEKQKREDRWNMRDLEDLFPKKLRVHLYGIDIFSKNELLNYWNSSEYISEEFRVSDVEQLQKYLDDRLTYR